MDKEGSDFWKFSQLQLSHHFKEEHCTVAVKHVWNVSKVTVCPIMNLRDFEELQSTIQDSISQGQALPFDKIPEVDEVVLVAGVPRNRKIESFRGRVKKIKEGPKIRVDLLDTGGKLCVTLQQLFKPTSEIMKHPIYGVTLKITSDKTIPDEIELPQDWELTYISRIGQLGTCTIDADGMYCGSLWMGPGVKWTYNGLKTDFSSDTSTNVSSDSPKPSSSPIKLRSGHRLSENLKDNVSVQIIFAFNVSRLMINAITDIPNMDELHSLIEQYIIDDKNVRYIVDEPKVGQIVLAPFDDSYYRAQVISVRQPAVDLGIIDLQVHVFYVDYGDEGDIWLHELRDPSAAIMQHPIYGAIMNLDGLPTNPPASRTGVDPYDYVLKNYGKESFTLQVINTDPALDDLTGQLWLEKEEESTRWTDLVYTRLHQLSTTQTK